MINEARFENEDGLTDFVKANTFNVFGENIEWDNENLPAETGSPMFPDLMGKDSDKCWVIVEAKLVAKRQGANWYATMRESVGQIIHYAHAFLNKSLKNIEYSDDGLSKISSSVLRLFIVTEVYAEPIENMCRLLRAHGINLNYISIERLEQ